MSFNGSGTFVINSTGQPVVANTVISATVFNALTADLASGLTNCITKDGQSTPTANIPMGSNKITGLANGTLIGDAANLGQVQSTVAKLISITGTDTVLGTMSPTLTAYAAGQLFYFIASGANTGAVTLNIDGLGAKAITRDGSTALAAGDINSGEIVVVIYDGTRFQMINAANSFGNTTINGTLTVTGNTGLQANVSVTSALSVGGTFAVTGAATLGSTLAVTGKSDLPTVSTASANAAVAVITDLSAAGASITSANVGTAVVTTGTVTNLTATSASVASVNAGVALLTTATVTNLTATGASIASANLGNAVISALTLTGVSVASANVGVANITDLRAVGASVTSANLGTAVVTNGTVTNLTATSASVASVNAAVALVTTGTVTNLTSTAASVASANVGTAVITTLTATGASIASANAGNVQATIASVGSANLGTAVITTGTLTNLTATSASVASVNAGVALVTTGTVTNLTSTAASIASANIGVAAIGSLSFTGASIASLNAGVANITDLRVAGASVTSANLGTAVITTGNLTFSSTAQRITGDMSNATVSSRLMFQNSVTNGLTRVGAIPNGTATESGYNFYNTSAVTAGELGQLFITSSEVTLRSGVLPTGSFLPMTFYTGGSERVKIDTSGNVGIGTASPACKLDINTGASTGTTDMIILGGLDNGSAKQTYGVVRMGIENNTAGAEQGNMDFQTVESGTIRNRIQINGSGYIAFSNGGTERMRIDSSGNVGIGGTPTANRKLELLGSFPVLGGNANSNGIYPVLEVPSAITGSAYVFRTGPSIAASTATTNVFHYLAANVALGSGASLTNSYGFYADAMTSATNNYGFFSNIASGSNRWNFYAAGTAQNYFAGNTFIATTGLPVVNGTLNVSSTANAARLYATTTGTAALGVDKSTNDSTTGQVFAIFTINAQATGSGQINANGASQAAFGTFSDRRLKENIVDLPPQLANICALRPVEFDYKAGGHQIGFIAQEMQEIYSDAVGESRDGMLTVTGWSKTEARLVKAIQELTARVAELEAK